ncbi:hypothetical protein KVR01_009516 [Diaporthe batatas]|uniref:uncharacterized protein n=1 Tax=Diaporthe batatas TaxID=748121 RepID=UPI001D03D457|nr:uncharacterized protein KVR01_009516 [Diaporthe batatas]KAG8161252.1 hypothetical protein KVR01_009516 [Diaporthe batatas]
MSGTSAMADFGLSCPQGGTFYSCSEATHHFIGCCTENPCIDGTGYCPQTSLRYTSYNKDSYRSILPQSCVAPYNESTWYTCSEIDSPFMGCCSSNPCADGGCPQKDLLAAQVSDIEENAAPFMASASSSGGGLSKGAIAGIAVGCAAAVLIVVGILFLLYRRREKRRRDELASKAQPNAEATPGVYMPSPYQDSMGSPATFPVSPYSPQHHPEHNAFGISNSPGQVPYERPVSTAPTWVSGHTHTLSDYPSISSLGTHTWMEQTPKPNLYPVSEMDATEITRPMSELAGSGPLASPTTAYKSGYEKVATIGEDEESPEKRK